MKVGGLRSACVGLLGIALLAQPAVAGKKKDRDDGLPCLPPINKITEGPDPIPNRCEEDESRPDPEMQGIDLAADPRDGGPRLVLWAARVAADHDLMFREWLGQGWSEARFLTATLADDRDPRAVIDEAGAWHIVWWQRDADRVLYTRRDPVTGGWSVDRTVALGGRRPAVMVAGGTPWIAFERVAADGRLDIALARPAADGSFVVRSVAETRRSDRLDLRIGRGADGPWLSWRDAEGRTVGRQLDLDLVGER